MGSVSLAEVQELVRHLPEEKLSHAYHLLRHLAEDQDAPSLQAEFLRLPVLERRRLLAQQASEMTAHYEQTAAERQAWQNGDLPDED